MKYIVGTRGSKLALVQTKMVCDRLKKEYTEDDFEIKVIQTKGDRIQDKPLNQIGAKGLFVKEIEEQILSGEVHIGVHSMKDMPAIPADGLIFAKAMKREDPRDVLILRKVSSLQKLPQGATIGTGSKRREFQLKKLRPDLNVVDIRGNVDTRLRKMKDQKLDGIVLAAAGIKRLGMERCVSQYLEIDEMIPAPAQGVLALEVSETSTELLRKINVLSDPNTQFCVLAERTFLQGIGGDCHMPIGAVCVKVCEEKGKEQYQLHTMFGDEQGTHIFYHSVIGTDAEQMAKEAVNACQ